MLGTGIRTDTEINATEFRNKPMSLWSINIQQKRQEHTMKSVSSINGVGKTGLVHAKKN